jgi:hypothetical protein
VVAAAFDSYQQSHAAPQEPIGDRPRRGVAFYLLAVVAGIAVFMLSLFITILVLRS